MKLSRKLKLGMASALLVLGLGSAFIVQAGPGHDGGASAQATVTRSAVLQNGCSSVGANFNNDAGANSPSAVFPGTIEASVQLNLLCNSTAWADFVAETLGTGAGADLAIQVRATCVAPQVNFGCPVGTQFFGGPATGGSFGLYSFFRRDAANYLDTPYQHIFVDLQKGHYVFDVLVGNQGGGTASVNYRSLTVHAGAVPASP